MKQKVNNIAIVWVLVAMFGAALLVIFGVSGHNLAQAETIVVYKSPTCGCCSKWVEHLQASGMHVSIHDEHNMSLIKKQEGIPSYLRSCHTAKVGGYIIEGHVPAQDIARLLKTRPAIKGLAVPGMPMGSPGMEGPRKMPYKVLAFDADGKTQVFSEY